MGTERILVNRERGEWYDLGKMHDEPKRLLALNEGAELLDDCSMDEEFEDAQRELKFVGCAYKDHSGCSHPSVPKGPHPWPKLSESDEPPKAPRWEAGQFVVRKHDGLLVEAMEPDEKVIGITYLQGARCGDNFGFGHSHGPTFGTEYARGYHCGGHSFSYPHEDFEAPSKADHLLFVQGVQLSRRVIQLRKELRAREAELAATQLALEILSQGGEE